MLPGMEMLACPNLAVTPEVMQHIVQVESGGNPFAIGVVGGQLVRQPKTLNEALATVQMLVSKGYNFSVGIAQVNRSNLGRYGLDSYRKAFSVCGNLAAGAQILAGCYSSAGNHWGKAFSCYYSGNFNTGFRDGYVQKVYASISHDSSKNTPFLAQDAIGLRSIPGLASSQAPGATSATSTADALRPVMVYASDSSPYRVALRSIAIDTAAAALMPLVVSAAGPAARAETIRRVDTGAPDTTANATSPPRPRVLAPPNTVMDQSAAMAQAAQARPPKPTGDGVFEPRVRGPNDPATQPAALAQAAARSQVDRADLRLEQRDASFVF